MRLIVNADDFGYTRGVTRGVLAAHRDGIVTATTLMANAPDTEDAARQAHALGSLDVGVHLVFTYGRPLTDTARIASLVTRDGTFPRVTDLLRRGDEIRAEDVLTEARAQYARARALLGREPTHLDTHHWVHDVAPIEEAVRALAVETRTALRSHGPAQRDRVRAQGIRTPDRFVRDFQGPRPIGVDALVSLLERLAPDGGSAELMCHPGDPDDTLLRGSSYAAERGDELATLTDPRVRTAIERLGIELINFRSL
ncbi:MAG TPA: ChbG/HpnK family deacetylase [Candidatus Limnocylindria bacterium]